MVSVPLRGLWFLSSDYSSSSSKTSSKVSVPLRGLWFLSWKAVKKKITEVKRGFRPLAGIMVLIDIVSEYYEEVTSSFRPLAGIMVLIRQAPSRKTYESHLVSVPLRGLWFLSRLRHRRRPKNHSCFRPLAGIMVLIS